MQVHPQLMILPCFNEARGKVDLTMFQKENMSARPISKDCFDEFYKDVVFTRDLNCSSKSIAKEEEEITLCNFNNCLDYYPRNNNKVVWPFKEEKCGNVTDNEMWEMLAQFVNVHSEENKINNFIIVTHHHKLRKKIFDVDRDENVGFANCCCVKLSNIHTPQKNNNSEGRLWNGNVIFEGFPDKLDKYNYLKEDTNIDDFAKNWGMIETILKRKTGLKLINLYIIRHGNSLHNKPVEVKRLDSTLTPLGIWQADILGKYLSNEIRNETDQQESKLYLCSSYLLRAQHTGIQIISNLVDISRYSKFLYLKKFNDFFSYFRTITCESVNTMSDNLTELWRLCHQDKLHVVRVWKNLSLPKDWGKNSKFINFLSAIIIVKFWGDMIPEFLNKNNLVNHYLNCINKIDSSLDVNGMENSFSQLTLDNFRNFKEFVQYDCIPNYEEVDIL